MIIHLIASPPREVAVQEILDSTKTLKEGSVEMEVLDNLLQDYRNLLNTLTDREIVVIWTLSCQGNSAMFVAQKELQNSLMRELS